MTSFIIKSHVNREPAPQWKSEMDSMTACPFCRIAKSEAPAHKVYETDKVIAILDILPLRPGHVLVIPKSHYSRLSELPEDIAGALGQAVTKVANAITKALENTALNVVCNQEYAQAVPHVRECLVPFLRFYQKYRLYPLSTSPKVHYHIIPAPTFTSSTKISVLPASEEAKTPLTKREMHRKEFEAREELDDDAATELVKKITAKL